MRALDLAPAAREAARPVRDGEPLGHRLGDEVEQIGQIPLHRHRGASIARDETGHYSSAVQRIFVGDVQGCADELEEILARARRELRQRLRALERGRPREPRPRRATARSPWCASASRRGAASSCSATTSSHCSARWLGVRAPRPHGHASRTCSSARTSTSGASGCAAVRSRSRAQLGGRALRDGARVGGPALDARRGRSRPRARRRRASPAPDREGARRRALRAARTSASAASSRVAACSPNGGWSARAAGAARRAPSPGTRRGRARGHDYGVVYGHWAHAGPPRGAAAARARHRLRAPRPRS